MGFRDCLFDYFKEWKFKFEIILQTILIVTHEHDIAQMTKRIVHLKDGVIIDDAPVKQVRTSSYVWYWALAGNIWNLK